MANANACVGCGFYEANGAECRIRAPIVVSVSVGQDIPQGIPATYGQTLWPKVRTDGWCGEWKKK